MSKRRPTLRIVAGFGWRINQKGRKLIMVLAENIIEKLRCYVKHNEVVYQVRDELLEVSNEENAENRKSLLGYLDKASSVELFEKGASFIHEPFEELDSWATVDDTLLLLEIIGVLICIPRSLALSAGLIEQN